HAQQDLRGALRRGGQVIYFRHGATTWSGVDRIEWPRARQRLLSDLGIRQSEQIGAAFRSEGFPVGDVLASPFARCRDMAEIAFGRVEERMELMGLLSDDNGRAARVAYLRQRMTTPPAIGTNRIIVSHRSNIAQVAGASLEEGEAVITRPNGTDFETLAQWMPADWTGA
ncbi:MAG: histidine phosphatase family protein, partial [Pseudomonadota bacterium]